MARFTDRKEKRSWRKIRIRKRLSGTAETPRVCVFKSHKYLYAQAVDDIAGKTLASASSQEPSLKQALTTSGKHVKAAEMVGRLLSERLKGKGIEKYVFDRSGYLYHGKVKALEAAINHGLHPAQPGGAEEKAE